MATFNRFDYGSHVTYQVVDAGNTLVNLSADEAYSLLDWLYQQRTTLYQECHAHDDERGDDDRKPRGLAALSPERRQEIARMGGEALKASGNRRTWSHEEAVENGHRGGKRSKRGPAKKHRSGDGETMTGSA